MPSDLLFELDVYHSDFISIASPICVHVHMSIVSIEKRNQNSFQCNERFQESVYQIIYAPIQPSNLSRLHMTEKGGKTIFRTTRCQSSFLRIIRIDVINIHDKYYNLVYLKQSSFELRRRTTTIDVFNRFHFFNGISHTFCMRHVSTIIGKKNRKYARFDKLVLFLIEWIVNYDF